MKKRLLVLVLTMCLALMLAVPAFGADYNDTDSHWAEDSIDRWSDCGIVEGYNGQFNPNGELTRGQLAVIITRLLNLPTAEDAGFGDTAGHWSEYAINACAAAGIMLGDGTNAYPDEAISREQTMVMLGRALGIAPIDNADLSKYGDGEDVSDWAAGYVAALTEAGIVNGIGGSLVPDADIDRASTVTILNKAITTYANEPGQTVEATGGIVLVVAPDVTVTGEADSVVVAQGATGGTTTLEDATVGEVTVAASESNVVVGDNSAADNVKVTEKATGTEVSVERSATVGTVTTEAADSKVEVSGKVENVEVAETATGTNVQANIGATISKVDNSADGTTVSGNGTVANVATSGDNTKVQTNGTKVEAAEGTTGTTAGNKEVAGGSTSTTPSYTDSHSHSYTYKALNNGKHEKTCCSTVEEACSYGEDNKCTKCGYLKDAAVKSGAEYYAALADAIAAGGEITLLSDITMTESIAITKDLTLDLGGKEITHNVDGFLFTLETGATEVEIIGTNGGKMTVPADHATAGGFVKSFADCKLTITGGTYTDNNEGMAYFFTTGPEGGSSKESELVLTNVTATGNNDMIIFSDEIHKSILVDGGTFSNTLYVFAVCAGGVDDDVVDVTIKNATITSSAASVVQVIGYTGYTHALFENCTITATGVDRGGAPPTAIAATYNGKVTVKSGTYTGSDNAPTNGKNALAIYTSGGTIVVEDGTLNGDIGLWVGDGNKNGAEVNADAYSVLVSSGIVNGEIKVKSTNGASVTRTITGGTFSKDPSDYVAPGYKVTEENGVCTVTALTEAEGVAKIGNTYYAALEEAVAVGGEITLLKDVVLTETLTVAADKTVVLDLNGKTIRYDSTIQGEAMITNKGNLTINDSIGEGVINYNYTGAADSTYGKGNYTISNCGTLTVNGGKITIANLSGHAKYPIDNNSGTGDAVLVINGGHLYNYNTSAIRQCCNSTTYKNSVTIAGGLVEGYCAIWLQNSTSKTVNGDLTITGGEIKSTAKAYVEGTSELAEVGSAIYCTISGDGGAWSENSFVTITGGTFNENVYLAVEAPASITIDEGVIFNGYCELPNVSETENNQN